LIFRLLDLIRAGGLVRVEVHDEGGYWQKRDIEALAEKVGEWNELMAAAVSKLLQKVEGQGEVVEAPIREFPNYEHLKAKGLERLEELQRRPGKGHE
jgi:hypothetical protein